MKNLYFLLTSLPELEYPKKPFLSYDELYTLIEQNISEKELGVFQSFRSWKDIENIRKMLLDEPFVQGGLLNRIELEEALKERTGLPSQVFTFMDQFKTTKEQLEHFPQLIRTLFHIESKGSSFFNKLMAFEERVRLTLAYIRMHHKGVSGKITPLESDEEDPFFQSLFASRGFVDVDEPYSQLPLIFESKKYSPFELELALIHFKFDQYEALTNINLFSFDQVMLYAAQFDLLEHLSHLESSQGITNAHQLFEVT